MPLFNICKAFTRREDTIRGSNTLQNYVPQHDHLCFYTARLNGCLSSVLNYATTAETGLSRLRSIVSELAMNIYVIG